MSAGDMWMDLSAWMQRREMIDYCAQHYDLDDDKETAKHLIAMIDIAIRNRIRGITESVENENLPKMPTLLSVNYEPGYRPTRPSQRKRCEKCLHVNRVVWCRCECHHTSVP